MVNLVWPAGTTLPPIVPATTPPSTIPSPYLGANSNTGTTPPTYDMKQHPYFRTEMLQKAMNLTTVRTHQYAVWITVGFFEVTRQGTFSWPASATPWLAFDTFGPEIGASTGQTTRYRGFFGRPAQLTGFDDPDPTAASARPSSIAR